MPVFGGGVGSFGSPAFELQLNINSDSWAAGWPDTTRKNMEYSNAHQHTNGRQLELAWALHSRPPADHTSVRWTDFAASGAPTQGYYWPEDDDQIWETDNLPTMYMPWKQWVCLWRMKVIDIATPAAIDRWESAAACTAAYGDETLLSMTDVFDIDYGGLIESGINSNYNPACLVNPDSTWTCWFGGGYFGNSIGANPATMKLIDDDPDYPATSSTPLRIRQFAFPSATTVASPTYTRHAIKIGDWIYWGGARVRDVYATEQFYRINVSDLVNSQVVTQERITDAPPCSGVGGRFSLLAGDVTRKRLYLVNGDGVSWYQIPEDDGTDGVWYGPYAPADFAITISDGTQDGITGDWYGFIGTHRSDLNQTFFRFNNSKKWNRISWPS